MDWNRHSNTGFFSELNHLGKLRIPFLFIIDFEGRRPLVFPAPVLPHQALFRFGQAGNDEGLNRHRPPLVWKANPVEYERFLQAFEIVNGHLRRGDSFLVNLTFPTPLKSSCSLEDIYAHTHARYKLHLPGSFSLFSPECFVRIERNQIHTFPMKGTIDASIPGAGERILADAKETAEHFTIVDLLRNDLNRVARKVRVEAFRYIEEVKSPQRNLLQVSSHIVGELDEAWPGRVGSILEAMLPAGSVSGAPKLRTLEIIRLAEGTNRGYYTGVAGWFDGSSLDSCVLIRFVGKTKKGLEYRSGGGITVNSDPRAEYQELLAKVYLPSEP